MSAILFSARAALIAAFALAAPGVCAAQTIGPAVDGQGATAQATFRGVVEGGCRLSVPDAASADNAVISAQGPGSADITVQQLVNEDAEVQGARIVLVIPTLCTQAHTLSLSSVNGGLASDQPGDGGPFRSNVGYTVTVDWAGGQQTFQTDGGLLNFMVPDAAMGDLIVTIDIPSGGDPLTAGAYTDEITLVLGVGG